uniref:Transcription factor n=1 Tax=Nicotiana benthamiana TaxID=4100 RepID=A0A0P0UVE6_NICBE|nr:transcription factor [Nicotiana benthamiana]
MSFPALTIPPRPSFESFLSNLPSFSPGPMSLVSSFFSDQSPDSSDYPSFSQLLAGAMASPLAKPAILPDNSGEGSQKSSGYKQNRPMGLVLAQSPLFMIPPGLSPSGLLNSPGFLSPLQSPFGMSHQQALAHVTAQAAFSNSYMQMQAEDQCSSQVASAEALGHELTTELEETSLQLKEPSQTRMDSEPSDKQGKKFELQEFSQSENKPSFVAVEKPPCDGYNWRKYGEKKVKASECPRSYYKCTNLKCPVKKKVERSVDGHITEITYNGWHNHELPQPTKQRKDGSTLDGSDCSEVRPDTRTHDWPVMNNSSDGSSHTRSDQVSNQMVSELLVKSECDEIKNILVAVDDGHDEPNAKRTKTAVETVASSHGTVAESKIVLQTRSEVEFLDDGYKWRKYGQKVVKGNQHPRSYYRCTYPGCNVRKQVERASTDPKSVITTYEGKHNHDIPTLRNRNSQR